ncbi:MAG: hypothetical protein PQJ60_01420, partial [Spirochaetales bacterium]|nr:hypothetical protein [Spirochaetales bacterium]
MAKNSILTLEDLAESTAHTLSFEGDYNTSQEERFFRIEPNGSGRFTLTLETRPAESATQEEVPLGEEQAIFSQWSRIKDREMGNFSWEKSDSSSLFMDEYTDFVDQILHSRIPLVMGKKGKELSKSSLRKGQVNLNISGTSGEEELSSSLTFHTEGRELRNPRILSPRHILIKDTVYSCFPGLGMNYSLLKQFEGRIKKRDLESYLSLFSSLFPNREIHYEDYYFYQTGITESAERGLRFTSLDEEGNLHLSLLWNLPPFSPKFINTSRPTQKITIDHKTRRVASTRISYQDSRELALTKLLQKYTKEKMSLHDEDFYLPAEQALPFLTENLSRLAGNFTLFGTEELETYKLKHLKPLPHIHLSSGIDFFEGQCEIELGPDKIPLNLA